MIMNQASNIMLGSTEVERVYQGNVLVWERKRTQYDPGKIAVILLDSQNNPTRTIDYFEQYYNAKKFIANHAENNYLLYVGKDFAEKNNMSGSDFSSLVNLISVYFSGSSASLFCSAGHHFENCTSLETVTIEGSCSVLSKYCFSGCTALKEIHIPDSVQELSAGCFKNCTGLQDFSFQENLSEIGYECFRASGLSTLSLDFAGVHTGSGVFRDCQNLRTAKVGYLVRSDNNGLSDYMFMGCTNLSSVIFSGDALWSATFRGCTNLSELTLKNVKTIKTNSFVDCPSLEEIYFPDSVTNIENYQFVINSGIKYIHIGSGILEIASNAFKGTPYLQEIHLDTDEGAIPGAPWGADSKTVAVTYST